MRGNEKINHASREIGLGLTPQTMTQLQQKGLGQGPDCMLQCGFTQVPVVEYVTWTTTLPITDDEITRTFGNEIDVLTSSKSVAGVDSVDSSFVINGLLQCDMLAIGFGVHIFGEPFSFATIGNSISSSATAPIWSPDTFTQNDLLNGSLGAAAVDSPLVIPAALEWGFPCWEAAWEMANAYQLQFVMQQRYLLINELCADVCYFGPYAEAVAAGSSDVIVQQFAAAANARYRDKGSTQIFQPVSARRVGSLTAAAPTPGTNVGVFHATRDFDLAATTHGGLRNQGGFANGQPFRRFIRPILLEQGTPIGIKMVVQDDVHQRKMQRYMSISESIGGDTALVPFDTLVNGLTPVGAAVGLEVTADTAITTSPEVVNTNRVIYKGGDLKVAVLIKGFEVWGAWKKYICDNWQGQVSMPSITGTSGGPIGVQR